jgi:hypothetical protein
MMALYFIRKRERGLIMEGTRATEVLILFSIADILLGSSWNSLERGPNAVFC